MVGGVRRTSRILTLGLLALIVGLPIVGLLVSESRTSTRAEAIETFRDLPLSFEANRGQIDPRVDFLARGIGHALFLTATEVVLVLTAPDSMKVVLRTTFPGANPRPRVAGLEELPGKANYFVGQNPTTWHTNVPRYATVQYTELYPGIDVRYSGDQRYVAYEFVVRPGTDPRRISLAWQGADSLEVDVHGDLLLRTAGGVVRQRKAVIAQELDGARREISGGYVRTAPHEVGLDVAAYDVSQPLVITCIVPFRFLAPNPSILRRFPLTPITPMR